MWVNSLSRWPPQLSDADLVASGHHRLGLIMVPAAVIGRAARCRCGGDADRVAKTCREMQGVREVCHPMLERVVRLSVAIECRSHVRAEASYPPLPIVLRLAPPAGARPGRAGQRLC
jgi:hypothetical protein